MHVSYVSPAGVEYPEVDANELRELVLIAGADYWGVDSCTGLLTRGAPETSVLHLMVDKRYGVFLIYRSNRGRFAPLTRDAPSGTVKVFPGGELMTVPLRYFVTREAAWGAIQEFLDDGRLPESLDWADSPV